MPLVFRNELTCHIGLELNIWIRTIGQANAIERVGEPLSHGGGDCDGSAGGVTRNPGFVLDGERHLVRAAAWESVRYGV